MQVTSKNLLLVVVVGLVSVFPGNSGDFVLVNSLKTWHEARDYCRTTYPPHGDLASVHTDMTENQLTAMLSEDAWIGLCQAPNAVEPDQEWQWADNSVYNVQYWNPTEPNDLNGEDCGVILTNGNWNDLSCTELKPFICDTSGRIVVQVERVTYGAYSGPPLVKGTFTKNHTHTVVGVEMQHVSGYVSCSGGTNGIGTGGESNWGCLGNDNRLDTIVLDGGGNDVWPTPQTQGTFAWIDFNRRIYELSSPQQLGSGNTLILIGPDRSILDGEVLEVVYGEAIFGSGVDNHGEHTIDILLLGINRRSFGNIKGDPHYKTLDGLTFNYDGPCSYVLSSNRCDYLQKEKENKYNSDPKFEIIGHQGRCSSREKNVICIHKIDIRIWGSEKSEEKNPILIELEGKKKFYLNGKKIKIPFNNTIFSIQNEIHTSIDRPTHLIIFYGIDIMFSNHGSGIFELSVSNKMGTLCGLLGNNNGIKDDDLTLKNGTKLLYSEKETEKVSQKIINKFGDSWMVRRENEQLRCILYPNHSYQSVHECFYDILSVQNSCENMIQTQFKKLHGRNVEKCFPKGLKFETRIDASRIYDDCVTEICSCDSRKEIKCSPQIAIQEFKEACSKNGVQKFPPIHWQFV